eukprot:CAMPEP_0197317438 /NCGR_PEP_ID=MMETSP0891-20130614/47069_1 /TAXON_ID=44058 ORGANISM="Aureoumbra lagunensis, Strain CCMP1510" /NCGR_SAMPLE_ID=MMETSP0891 /ASSEMBLY_ACC=CAM_ASM_000534 /LENGTH=213 /DNA_ID=CAMNT_0042807437 /DNA_START=191 /DNA_END=832 /DNA_ORIENTATION=+
MGLEAAKEMAVKEHIPPNGTLQELALAITQQSLGEGLELQTTDDHAATQALSIVRRFCAAFNASPDEIDSGLCALDPRCYMLRYHTSGHIYSPGAHNVKLGLLQLQSQFRISGELRSPFIKVHAHAHTHAIIFIWCRLDYRHIETPPDGAFFQFEISRFDEFSLSAVCATPVAPNSTTSNHNDVDQNEFWLISAIKLAPAPSLPQLGQLTVSS